MKRRALKKIIITTLLLSTMVSMGLVGCSAKGESANEGEKNSNNTEVGTYPVVKEQITLKMYAPLRNGITSYDADKNTFTKWVEDKTNIKIEWLTSTEADNVTKVNTLLTSGTYPEVMINSNLSPSELQLYGEQGVIIPLNDLIDKYAPNVKKAMDANPLIKEAMTSPDGKIYSLSPVGKSYHMLAQNKMWINTKWLDKLGLKMPTTTDEFYNVLKAFKENDPNGNGTADEIALAGSTNGWNTKPQLFLMNAFVPYTNGNTRYLYLENGKIFNARLTEGYKEGLKYLNKLYKDGLLDNLTYSQNNDQLKKVANNPEVAVLGAFGGGTPGAVLDLSGERWLDYKAVPPLKGPKGEQNIGYFPDFGFAFLQITDKCQNPEAVMRMFDLMFTEEGMLGNNFGELDVDYAKAAAGQLNVLGEPAKYKLITKATERDGRTWNQLGPYYRPADYDTWWVAKENDLDTILYNETKSKYIKYKIADKDIVPVLAFNEEDSRQLVDIEIAMNKYMDEMMVKFIMGEANVDTDWDS